MAVKMHNTNHARAREGWFLLGAAALILGFYFYKLYNTLEPQLQKAEQALREGRAIKLEAGVDKDKLKKIIADGNYYSDQHDIDLLADSLTSKLLFIPHPGEPWGALNKTPFAVFAPVDWKPSVGGTDFYNRLRASRQRLGLDSALYVSELNNPMPLSDKVSVSNGELSMKGRVLWQGKPMAGVLIELRQHSSAIPIDDSLTECLSYARTNADGEFVFTGLHRDSGYSLLPMKPGFEFGAWKGTSGLPKNTSYTFTAKPHKIRLIGAIAYGQLKEDSVLLVRTPDEFRSSFQLVTGGLLLSFCWLISYCRRCAGELIFSITRAHAALRRVGAHSFQHSTSAHRYFVCRGIIAGYHRRTGGIRLSIQH